MYYGRTLAVAKSQDEQVYLFYRVSSRSFSNRKPLEDEKGKIAVIPSGDNLDDFKNAYVTYNCARYNEDVCVLTNGAQTDPIFEKIVRGASARDSLISVMSGMDYEFDGHNTPRISLVADARSNEVYLSRISKQAFHVAKIELQAGETAMIATNSIEFEEAFTPQTGFDAANTDEAFSILKGQNVFLEHEHGVLGVATKLEKGFNVVSGKFE